jgi:exodeoxyribonuclease VII small subunit
MSTSPHQSKSFEEAFHELEQCVQRLEDGGIPLEEALRCYEQGVSLLVHCQNLLRQAQHRIEALTGVDEEGRPRLQPFELD